MRILPVALLTLWLVPSWSGPVRLPLLREASEIRVTPVPLRRVRPDDRRLGALTYLGGVRLSNGDPAFGGFSALHVAGDRMTLLGDGGGVVRFRLGQDWTVRDVRFANLRQGPGRGWEKQDRDSEALTIDPATGAAWIAFERANAIWRYSPDLGRAEQGGVPPAMRKWPSGTGAEAMVRLRSGAFVVLSEGARKRREIGVAAIWFDDDPTERPRRGFRFRYLPPRGYSATDAVELTDERLLVLNRRFKLIEGFSAVLSVVDTKTIQPGAVVRGRVIARFADDVLHDNFEALAATQEADATMLWIASDDNQSMLQQTLLLKFRLDLPPPGGR